MNGKRVLPEKPNESVTPLSIREKLLSKLRLTQSFEPPHSSPPRRLLSSRFRQNEQLESMKGPF